PNVTNKPAPCVSWVLLVVLVVALATGAAASILVTASTAPPSSSGTASLVILPEWAQLWREQHDHHQRESQRRGKWGHPLPEPTGVGPLRHPRVRRVIGRRS